MVECTISILIEVLADTYCIISWGSSAVAPGGRSVYLGTAQHYNITYQLSLAFTVNAHVREVDR